MQKTIYETHLTINNYNIFEIILYNHVITILISQYFEVVYIITDLYNIPKNININSQKVKIKQPSVLQHLTCKIMSYILIQNVYFSTCP